MNILGHYYLSFEIIISVSFFCEIGFSFLPTASSVCDLIAGSHTFCYRVCMCSCVCVVFVKTQVRVPIGNTDIIRSTGTCPLIDNITTMLVIDLIL